MARLKSHPLFTITFSLLLAVAVGAGVLLYLSMGKVSAAARAVKQKSQTLASYTQRTPFPSEENVAAAQADLVKADALLATMQSALKGRGEFAQRVQNAVLPVGPTEAYFDLATFVESMRSAAQAAGVALPADSRFGFVSYSRTGPDKDLIPQVHRQRLVAEYLLTTLFKSAPQELVSLQRNRPVAPGAAAQVAAPVVARGGNAGGATPESDFFTIDPRMTATVPGFVDTLSFKLTFVGYSDSLRQFLNEVASFDLPLVVRSVEVESVVEKDQKSRKAPATTQSALSALFGSAAPAGTSAAPVVEAKPIVEQVRSKFTVTIEYITLVETSTDTQPTS